MAVGLGHKKVSKLISSENQAVKDYERSAIETEKDNEKQTFKHIRKEEKHHAKMLNRLR